MMKIAFIDQQQELQTYAVQDLEEAYCIIGFLRKFGGRVCLLQENDNLEEVYQAIAYS